MPYEAYTNESDEIFAQQLDSMKLSSTAVDPRYSSIGANVARTNLGFDREMGLDMESKMRMHQQGMLTRQSISEDKSKAFEATEFKDAMDVLSTSLTGDIVADTMVMQDLARKNPGNKMVQDAISGMYSTSNRLAEAKRTSFANEREELIRSNYDADIDAEVVLNGQKAELATSREILKKAEYAEGETEEMVFNKRSEFAGNVAAIDPELGQKAAMILENSKDLNMPETVMKRFESVLKSVVQTDGLEKAAAKALGRNHMNTLNSLKQAGINLDEVTDEEAIDQYIQKQRKNPNVNLTPEREAEIREIAQESLAKYREQESVADLRDGIIEELKGILPDKPKVLTDEEKLELQMKFSAFNNKMQQVAGNIRKIEGEYEADLKREERLQAIQKENLAMLNTQSMMKNREDRIKLSQQIFEMEKLNANSRQFNSLFSSMPSEIKETLFDGFVDSKKLKDGDVSNYPGGARQLLLDFAKENNVEEDQDAFKF